MAYHQWAGGCCKRGHLLIDDNIYTYPNGERTCRACRVLMNKKWWRELRLQNERLMEQTHGLGR